MEFRTLPSSLPSSAWSSPGIRREGKREENGLLWSLRERNGVIDWILVLLRSLSIVTRDFRYVRKFTSYKFSNFAPFEPGFDLLLFLLFLFGANGIFMEIKARFARSQQTFFCIARVEFFINAAGGWLLRKKKRRRKRVFLPIWKSHLSFECAAETVGGGSLLREEEGREEEPNDPTLIFASSFPPLLQTRQSDDLWHRWVDPTIQKERILFSPPPPFKYFFPPTSLGLEETGEKWAHKHVTD